MKKINILIAIGLFVLLVGMAQPVAGLTLGGTLNGKYGSDAAQVTGAISRFEGLLNAYTSLYMVWNQPIRDYSIKKQLSIAAHDLSSSLEQFNTALVEVYPTLTEGEQLAVEEAYSQMGIYLEQLATNANSILGKEVLRIEYGEPLSKISNSTTQGRFITIIDDLNSDL